MVSSVPQESRTTAGQRSYVGFITAAVVALLLLGTLVTISNRLAEMASDSSKMSEPSTTGSAWKDPAYSQPAKPAAR